MKKLSFNKSALLAAVTVAGFAAAPLVNAASNPFSNMELASGFNLDHAKDQKAGGEGKCGEGTKACTEGKCGEGQCGEKCGNKKDKKSDDVIKADENKMHAEGKCGEGKCGEAMMGN
jgi:uncharacterized low-complexity protein